MEGAEINEDLLQINTAWSSRLAIISYDNYGEHIILEDDQLKWTALKKAEFSLLENGLSSIGVYLTDKEIGYAYSNKWSYRSKSKNLLRSILSACASRSPGRFRRHWWARRWRASSGKGPLSARARVCVSKVTRRHCPRRRPRFGNRFSVTCRSRSSGHRWSPSSRSGCMSTCSRWTHF